MLFWTFAGWIRSVMFHTDSYWSSFLRKTTQKLRPQSNPWPREVAAHEGALLLQRQEEGQEEGADRKRHAGSDRRSIVWSVRARCRDPHCRDPRGYCHRASHWAFHCWFGLSVFHRDASKTVSSPPTSPRPGSVSGSTGSNVVPPRQQKPAASGATRKKAPQKKKKGGKGGW